MVLQTLIFCTDERVIRVLRRVLSDLEISVEHCTDADSAVRQLTRRRFEAVIVDCLDENVASLVLKSVRTAPCNKRAVAVAIIDGQKALRSAFDLGAHFVLYKPISAERARSSFRAVRALMKRERRRNTRVAVQIPVTILSADGSGQERSVTTDISEGGIALTMARRSKRSDGLKVQFTVPGTDYRVECTGEISWENAGRHTGIRFVDLPSEAGERIKEWLEAHSSDIEKDDPPAACELSDLSVGGCYLEITSPFPIRTRVLLSMSVGGLKLQASGVVRVMHPEVGMGIEFIQSTPEQKEHVTKFIHSLVQNGESPQLLVEPEGLEDSSVVITPIASPDDGEDLLLELFRTKAQLTTEIFQEELRKQRGSKSAQPAVTSI